MSRIRSRKNPELRSLRRGRQALVLCAALALTMAACAGSADSPTTPAASPPPAGSTSPSSLPSPDSSRAVQQLPDWFRAMVLRVSRFWGDRHPERAWWALTTDEKADLAGGNPGGDPAKQVYFAVVQGHFRSGEYQFFSIKADPAAHKRLGLVVGGGFDRTAVGAMAAFDPYLSISARELSAAEAVVRRLVTAVDDDDFARARSLMIDPDANWSLEDMRSIRWVRLRRVALLRVDAPHTAWLITDLRRQPPPIAGNPYWPNFMLVVRTSSGEWKVTATATGP